ncbi:hypothetical protein B0H17DRAFT_257358 [Mycena rosella]|uniref:Uncharacterized protein n=1 Tax=Mycena rosella TaxID=1033263 RepID=A0AAD7CWQ1_MYCRO|nr:hypothetical protein B0H17DRAFT_257358 [Mycena rosella]
MEEFEVSRVQFARHFEVQGADAFRIAALKELPLRQLKLGVGEFSDFQRLCVHRHELIPR